MSENEKNNILKLNSIKEMLVQKRHNWALKTWQLPNANKFFSSQVCSQPFQERNREEQSCIILMTTHF